MNDDIFAYLCPKCKTVNTLDKKYCIHCGHWLLDSNFSAIPISRKEFHKINDKKNKLLKQNKPSEQNKGLPYAIYLIFTILILSTPIEIKSLLSVVLILYGIINIIYPIRKLLINNRGAGFGIFIFGILLLSVFASQYKNPNVNNDLTVVNKTDLTTIEKTNLATIKNTSTYKNPQVNLEEFKSQCIDLAYEDLARETEKYINSKIKITGQIFQIQENGKELILLVNITKISGISAYEDTIWVNYTLKNTEKHFLKNDIINIWGVVDGRKTYTTVLGSSLTIPEITAKGIEIINN